MIWAKKDGTDMFVKDKVAVIFGGSGAIGGAIAAVLAREGAHVCLGARNQNRLDLVREKIRNAGGRVDTFIVDVFDDVQVNQQIINLAEKTGGIDIVVNAMGFIHDQGKVIEELNLNEFLLGVTPFLSAQFNLCKAVLPFMGGHDRAGVIISVVAPAASMAVPGHLGHIVGCAAIEAFVKALASELGPKNIRAVCIRSHAISDAIQAGSYTREVFAAKAQAMGLTVEQWLEGAAQSTMLKRLPTLEQVAEMAAFLASDQAGAMTATVVNMTGGATIS